MSEPDREVAKTYASFEDRALRLTSDTSTFIRDVVSETFGRIISLLEEFSTFETE